MITSDDLGDKPVQFSSGLSTTESVIAAPMSQDEAGAAPGASEPEEALGSKRNRGSRSNTPEPTQKKQILNTNKATIL